MTPVTTTTPTTRAQTPFLNPVLLHAMAENALSRCLHELRSERTSYDLVARQLSQAIDSVRALGIIGAHLSGRA